MSKLSPELVESEAATAVKHLSLWPGVRRIWLFGSGSRNGAPFDWRSDLDFAVEGMSALDQGRAWAELDEALALPVDLVRWEQASPVLRDQIRLGRLIYERHESGSH